MRLRIWIGVLMLAFAASAHARDIVGFHENVHVHEGDEIKDIVCAFCTITIDGAQSGDTVLAFSHLDVAPNAEINGDLVSAFTRINFQGDNRVSGDLVYFGSEIGNMESLKVSGDRLGVPGPVAILALLAPFALIAGIVWLIISLVRRRRYASYPPPGYRPPPPGYGPPPSR